MWIIKWSVSFWVLLLMVGCSNSNAVVQPALEESTPAAAANAEEENMPQSSDLAQAILGAWTKRSDDACADQYADTIHFEENGLFSASGGQIVFWDAGQYEIRSPTQVMISNSYDAEIVYSVTLDEDTLTFVDDAGCTFTYQRE